MNPALPTDGATPLTHWGVIRARGADAASFLHSQLTNDMSLLGLGQARWAGFCSAKGRLQASFLVWKTAHDEFLLACAADLLAPTLKRLSMFVLRAKCKLDDASAEWPLTGLVGTAAFASAGDASVLEHRVVDGASVIRLPDAAGVVRVLRAGAGGVNAPALSPDTWRWLEVQSGVPTVEAATVDQFVPQMLNLELIGGVDFQKGCYPGQEIVARSQYRGTLKRRMFRADTEAPARPGDEVFHSADPGQPAGMVVNAAAAPDGGSSVLVELKIAATDAGSLHLGAADGPLLQLRSLPYALPAGPAESA